VGVNIHSNEGQMLLQQYSQGSREEFIIPGAPFIAILRVDNDGNIQNIGSRYADEINITSIFEMCDTANSMLVSVFGPGHDVEDFNIADSNLAKVETEETKNEIEEKLKNKNTTGFVESRTRQREIDQETGMPLGMTEKQIEDKLIKDKQQQELSEAMKADRVLLEERRQKQEEEAKQRNEEIKKQDELNRKHQDFKETAKVVKESLPEEPDEEDPDAVTVQFRMPDGSQTVQRRFLKTDKIQLLYDYIHSLGADNEYEHLSANFTILQNFPKKIFENMGNTLEAEGLFPRCKLYIREHSQAQ
jgi:hypothetical protein